MNTCTSSDMLYSNWGLLTKGTAGTQLLAQNSDVCQDKELNRVHKQTLLIGGVMIVYKGWDSILQRIKSKSIVCFVV